MKKKKKKIKEAKSLKTWTDIIDILQDFAVDADNLILDFGHKKISLPYTPEYEQKLKNQIGKNVGILCTDMINREYIFWTEGEKKLWKTRSDFLLYKGEFGTTFVPNHSKARTIDVDPRNKKKKLSVIL